MGFIIKQKVAALVNVFKDDPDVLLLDVIHQQCKLCFINLSLVPFPPVHSDLSNREHILYKS